MAKYCKPMGLRVTYMDCLECEEKECKKNMDVLHKKYLRLEPKQECYMVYKAKKFGDDENTVVKCYVRECIIRSQETLYVLVPEKIMTRKSGHVNMERNYICINSTIDTGTRNLQKDIYPVFIEKDKCLEWLKK